jgi:hypothetical protein
MAFLLGVAAPFDAFRIERREWSREHRDAERYCRFRSGKSRSMSAASSG